MSSELGFVPRTLTGNFQVVSNKYIDQRTYDLEQKYKFSGLRIYTMPFIESLTTWKRVFGPFRSAVPILEVIVRIIIFVPLVFTSIIFFFITKVLTGIYLPVRVTNTYPAPKPIECKKYLEGLSQEESFSFSELKLILNEKIAPQMRQYLKDLGLHQVQLNFQIIQHSSNSNEFDVKVLMNAKEVSLTSLVCTFSVNEDRVNVSERYILERFLQNFVIEPIYFKKDEEAPPIDHRMI